MSVQNKMSTRKARKLRAKIRHIMKIEGICISTRKRSLRALRRAQWKLMGGNRPTWLDHNA